MNLKFTGELCVIIMKNDGKLEEELACYFKIDTKNSTNIDQSTPKPQKSELKLAAFDRSI